MVTTISSATKKGDTCMKKIYQGLMIVGCISFSSVSYANWFADIVNRIEQTNVINTGMLNRQGEMVGLQRDMLSSQRDIETLMREVRRGIVGNSGWGVYQFHDYQSYGASANQWSQVMQMANRGQGAGDLGRAISDVANQFPVDQSAYNRGVSDRHSQQYYALKSETVLAVRAASQLDYNKIQVQIAYQQMLQQQIEKTKDLKAAVDLSNRIQVEGNLINLELLRQVALTNQQHAITEQASINTALSHARFLTKE